MFASGTFSSPRGSGPVRRLIAAILTFTSTLVLSSTAGAQCEKWLAGPLTDGPDGTNGPVNAMTLWDPDGPGPKGETIVVGGNFTTIQGQSITNLAMRDPDTGTWVAVSPSVTAPTVNALAVYQGQLVVGTNGDTNVGTFDIIVRWDGSTWHNLAASNTGSALVLYVHNGDLYVGGSFQTNFTSLGTNPAHSIARWNPVTNLWDNLNSISVDGSVRALASWNGELIVGGSFSILGGNPHHGIARWNGSSWISMGLTAGNVTTIQPFIGGLYVGGGGLNDGTTNMGALGRWSGGSWSSVGGTFPGSISDMTVYNGRLIIAGAYANGGSPNILQFDGTSDLGLGSGIGTTVLTMLPYAGVLFVGGSFTTADGIAMNRMAIWNGSGWSKLGGGTVGGVLAMTNFMGQLVGAGGFSQSAVGIQPAVNIVGWNGTSLNVFGSGLNDQVNALKSFKYPGLNGDFELIAGGYFTVAGGVGANRIARWDQDPILAFPPPAWQAMGPGFDGPCLAIERFNNITYAGGSFFFSGGTALANIGRWNETSDQWENIVGSNGPVYAMKVYGSYLYVGGSFTAIGGISTGGFARYDGVSWSNVGGFFLGSVYALEVYNGLLVIGGDYAGINSSPDLAYYNGSFYGTFGVGGSDQAVTALHANGSRLYVGGTFNTLGGVPVGHLGYWDGSWHGVAGGVDNTVYAMGSLGSEEHVGGVFVTAGGPLLTKGWARYSATGLPWFVQQPFSQNVSSGVTVTFTARPTADYGQVTLQWQKNGSPLTNGPTGTGSIRSGVDQQTLTLENVTRADAGYYKLVGTHACGVVASSEANLTVDGLTAVDPSEVIDADVLGALEPNPSSGSTRLAFALARAGQVRMRVHDVTGRLVRRIDAGSLPAGRQQLSWDGRDDTGHTVRIGLYFIGLEAGGRTLGTRRVVIQR
jgi:hypothetical protein